MRTIDADALVEKIKDYPYGYRGMIEADIAQMPTVSPKQGRWIEPKREGCLSYDKKAYAECSVCGKKEYLGWGKAYCPNCGARMRGEEDGKSND